MCISACRFFRSFTLETIIAAAFGRVIEIQKGQSDELTEAAANIFNVAEETKATSVIYFNMLLSEWYCIRTCTDMSDHGILLLQAIFLGWCTFWPCWEKGRREIDPSRFGTMLLKGSCKNAGKSVGRKRCLAKSFPLASD